MKKIIALLLILSTFTLSSCSSSKTTSDEDTSTTTAPSTTAQIEEQTSTKSSTTFYRFGYSNDTLKPFCEEFLHYLQIYSNNSFEYELIKYDDFTSGMNACCDSEEINCDFDLGIIWDNESLANDEGWTQTNEIYKNHAFRLGLTEKDLELKELINDFLENSSAPQHLTEKHQESLDAYLIGY